MVAVLGFQLSLLRYGHDLPSTALRAIAGSIPPGLNRGYFQQGIGAGVDRVIGPDKREDYEEQFERNCRGCSTRDRAGCPAGEKCDT